MIFRRIRRRRPRQRSIRLSLRKCKLYSMSTITLASRLGSPRRGGHASSYLTTYARFTIEVYPRRECVYNPSLEIDAQMWLCKHISRSWELQTKGSRAGGDGNHDPAAALDLLRQYSAMTSGVRRSNKFCNPTRALPRQPINRRTFCQRQRRTVPIRL